MQAPMIGYSSTTWYRASHIILKTLRCDSILSLKNLNFPQKPYHSVFCVSNNYSYKYPTQLESLFQYPSWAQICDFTIMFLVFLITILISIPHNRKIWSNSLLSPNLWLAFFKPFSDDLPSLSFPSQNEGTLIF